MKGDIIGSIILILLGIFGIFGAYIKWLEDGRITQTIYILLSASIALISLSLLVWSSHDNT